MYVHRSNICSCKVIQNGHSWSQNAFWFGLKVIWAPFTIHPFHCELLLLSQTTWWCCKWAPKQYIKYIKSANFEGGEERVCVVYGRQRSLWYHICHRITIFQIIPKKLENQKNKVVKQFSCRYIPDIVAWPKPKRFTPVWPVNFVITHNKFGIYTLSLLTLRM